MQTCGLTCLTDNFNILNLTLWAVMNRWDLRVTRTIQNWPRPNLIFGNYQLKTVLEENLIYKQSWESTSLEWLSPEDIVMIRARHLRSSINRILHISILFGFFQTAKDCQMTPQQKEWQLSQQATTRGNNKRLYTAYTKQYWGSKVGMIESWGYYNDNSASTFGHQ